MSSYFELINTSLGHWHIETVKFLKFNITFIISIFVIVVIFIIVSLDFFNQFIVSLIGVLAVHFVIIQVIVADTSLGSNAFFHKAVVPIYLVPVDKQLVIIFICINICRRIAYIGIRRHHVSRQQGKYQCHYQSDHRSFFLHTSPPQLYFANYDINFSIAQFEQVAYRRI